MPIVDFINGFRLGYLVWAYRAGSGQQAHDQRRRSKRESLR